jgi:prepilin-type processing-associated H-X9-DG protein
MGIAIQNYEMANGHFPQQGTGPMGQAVHDPQVKPLLSWRVAILPYIEQNSLYNQFNQNEPWDGPTNKKLLPLMPKVYMIPGKTPSQPGMTYYQGFSGPGSMFEPGARLTMRDVADGTSNTLMIVEAGTEVPWTKPDDLPFDPKAPLPPLGGHFSGGFNVIFVDGSVRFIPARTPEATLKAMITRNGGEAISLP